MIKMELTPPLFVAILALIGTMIGVYVRIMMKIREMEIRIGGMEKSDDRIMGKLDEISDSITEVKVTMANKQDRSNTKY